MSAGKKNAYVCPVCGHRTVTVDLVDDVTPMFLRCRRPDRECRGMASSSFYRVDQSLEATWEWYRPTARELAAADAETRAHVRRGGLLPRKVAPPPTPRTRRSWGQ